MPTVKRLEDLKNQVLGVVAYTFKKDVNEYVKKKVNSRIKTDVYGSYSPQVYKRKYLLYLNRHHTQQTTIGNNEVLYKYEHRAMFGNGNLSKLIILGQEGARRYTGELVPLYRDKYIQEYKASGATDTTPFYEPRNFIQGAISDIDVFDIFEMLDRGLN